MTLSHRRSGHSANRRRSTYDRPLGLPNLGEEGVRRRTHWLDCIPRVAITGIPPILKTTNSQKPSVNACIKCARPQNPCPSNTLCGFSLGLSSRAEVPAGTRP